MGLVVGPLNWRPEMSNWKQTAAAAIVKHEAPAVSDNSDLSLYHQLKVAIEGGKIASRDLDFAKSLQNGFVKYGSFTDRQRPHVERLIAAPKRAAESPDKALAEALRAALPYIAPRDVSFAESLLSGYERYGSFSDRQRPYAQSLANSFPASIERAPAPAKSPFGYAPPQPKPAAPAPAPKTLCPNICATVNLNKFSRFTVGKLGLSLKNDGSVIWVKWDGKIAGSINPATTEFRPSHRYIFSAPVHAACLAEIVRVEADPLGAAKENGVLTGRCSCCGRPLTDPNSIAIGIGPICLEQFN